MRQYDEKLADNLEQMQSLKTSFSELPPYRKPKLMQRIGKKRTYWYVQPFGNAQNAFNAAAADAVTQLAKQLSILQSKVAALSERTGDELTALRQEQRNAVSRSSAAAEAALQQLAAEIDSSLSATSPESRVQAGVPPLTALPVLGTETLFREIHAVQQSEHPAETDAALDALEESYDRQLRDLLNRQSRAQEHRAITVVCRSFDSAGDSVRREAFSLYQLLKRASRYPALLLSVEEAGTELRQHGDFCFVPENRLSEWIGSHEPALLVICEPSPELLTAGNQCLLLRNAIVRLSGQNPMQNVGGSRMQELLHLNDYGLHRYIVSSAQAADVLESNGFRRPQVMYPYTGTVSARTPRAFDAARFTVGVVADSQELETLRTVIAQNPETQFVVLLPDAGETENKNAKNCEIRTGTPDYPAFFDQIDCLLVLRTADAVDCPLDAADALRAGIPVVTPLASGIAELVTACGSGIVTDGTDTETVRAALQRIRDEYAAFTQSWRLEKLRALTDAAGFVHEAEAAAAAAISQPVHTLYEWNRQLKQEKTYLIKGAAALKGYCQRRDPAAEAVVRYPQNCFDLMEEGSVRGLLEHLLAGSTQLQLLDLNSGTGRILNELLPFGKCTAYDASAAMLRTLQEDFPDVTLREADPLSDGIRGTFDVITVFRLLRHYEYGTRRKLWQILREALNENGILLMDVPNRNFELPLRAKNGWGKYPVYDVFWTKDTFCAELAANGLSLLAWLPVGQGLYPLPAEFRNEPMTWTACIRRTESYI